MGSPMTVPPAVKSRSAGLKGAPSLEMPSLCPSSTTDSLAVVSLLRKLRI